MTWYTEVMTDKDLIAELRKRKRIRVVTNTTVFYNELAEDERYMLSIYDDLIRPMAWELNNKLWISFDDRVIAVDADERPVRSTRTATLTVLLPEGIDDTVD